MRLKVLVKFNKDFIERRGEQIVIGIKAKPEKGKANAAIIKKLAKFFCVPISKIKIVSGLKSKVKIVKIEKMES